VDDNLCCDKSVEGLALDPTELRAVAERLAAEAADFVRRRREEVFSAVPQRESTGPAVRAKSTPTDPVTVVDTETERLLRDRLAELRPGERVLGEEGGGRSDDSAGRPTWVVDPIDGTVNFVYGLPAYGVSVAVQVDGKSVAGAVADVVDGALYSAARGQGAHVRRGTSTSPLRCSQVTDLSMSLVGTGFSYDPQLRQRQALRERAPGAASTDQVVPRAAQCCWGLEGGLLALLLRVRQVVQAVRRLGPMEGPWGSAATPTFSAEAAERAVSRQVF